MHKNIDKIVSIDTVAALSIDILSIDNAATAYVTLLISIYNCTNCDQLHVKI